MSRLKYFDQSNKSDYVYVKYEITEKNTESVGMYIFASDCGF